MSNILKCFTVSKGQVRPLIGFVKWDSLGRPCSGYPFPQVYFASAQDHCDYGKTPAGPHTTKTVTTCGFRHARLKQLRQPESFIVVPSEPCVNSRQALVMFHLWSNFPLNHAMTWGLDRFDETDIEMQCNPHNLLGQRNDREPLFKSHFLHALVTMNAGDTVKITTHGLHPAKSRFSKLCFWVERDVVIEETSVTFDGATIRISAPVWNPRFMRHLTKDAEYFERLANDGAAA